MSILRDMSGEFTVTVDGETRQYDNFNDIPDKIDSVDRFEPHMPEGPHTVKDRGHAGMDGGFPVTGESHLR